VLSILEEPEKDAQKISKEIKKGFRIYFPTHETVAHSKGGIGVSHLNYNLSSQKQGILTTL
jgi:hypothetical protein